MKFDPSNNRDIEPDEIFIDNSNLSGFNTQQFEGWLEKPISVRVFFLTFLFFLIIVSFFSFKLWGIQVTNGGFFAKRSESNSLKKIPYIPERGVLRDRNDMMLAWNGESEREYTNKKGVASVLGYLGYPSEEETKVLGLERMNEFVGKDGAEKLFNEELRGTNGTKIVEVDVFGNVQSESTYDPGVKGKDIPLSVDADVSDKMYEIISGLSAEKGFSGGAGVIMDIRSGELIASVSFPEYDPNVMGDKKDADKFRGYLNDKRMPFLNRVVSGLYLPGSVMKPVFALAALDQGIISPEKEIYSAGFISIPNPYSPDKPSVFKDWKALGWMNMRKAIAFSSDVYFYAIGGGYEDQKGLGIANIEKYARMFGFGTTTGVELFGEAVGNIPSPAWKEEVFNGEKWNLGNTYHTVIGQYGFQVTLLQMAHAIGAIASDGIRVTPTILRAEDGGQNRAEEQVSISKDKFNIIKEGMRMSVTEGTASGLNIPGLKIAAKTGTAELGVSKKYVNSWVVGFFPYEDPEYSFAVVMEKGPKENTVGGVYVMRTLFDWMIGNKSPYIAGESKID